MLKFLADQNFNHNIVRGLLRRSPAIDIVSAQERGLSRMKDPQLLEWVAREQRVLLTHDVLTMTKYVYDRLNARQAMPGLIEVSFFLNPGQVIEDLLLLAECSFEGEYEGQIIYLPLK